MELAIRSVYNSKGSITSNSITSNSISTNLPTNSHIPIDVAPPAPNISTTHQSVLTQSEHNNNTSTHNNNTNSVAQSATETVNNKGDALPVAGSIAAHTGDLITWDPKTVDLVNQTRLRQHIVSVFVVTMHSYCECCIDCNGKGFLREANGARQSIQIYLSRSSFIRLQRI